MLYEQSIDKKYAYVFWAPKDQVESLLSDWTPPEPPIFSWGTSYKGYLLTNPSYAFFFRYKAENPNWVGYTGNLKCYDTITTNEPIPYDGMDGFCPELIGSDFTSIDEI